MALTSSEILLSLRAPGSGWLGVLATVLDEANQDPRFDAAQRSILQQLLDQGSMSSEVADAARERAARFESDMHHEARAARSAATAPVTQSVTQRPKLTLVGQA